MINSIPICYYPTRKILLDDDQAFSESMILKMHSNNFLSYHSPRQTIKYLLEDYKPLLSYANLIDVDTIVSSSSQHNISIQLEKLEQIFKTHILEDISVLLVDYHMPEMYGIDFLKEIKHLPIKKILITGENDYKIAVEAFNDGLVDIYIRKDDPHFSSKLQN